MSIFEVPLFPVWQRSRNQTLTVPPEALNFMVYITLCNRL